MQSKTINWAVLVMPIFLMNGFVAFIRPVNVLGIVVMNAAYCAILFAALSILRKYVKPRNL